MSSVPHFLRPAASRRRPRSLAAALILAASGWAGCRPATEPPPTAGDVVATVGNSVITATELRAECERRADRGQRLEPRVVLDDLVLREALVNRARALGLDREPEVVRAWKRLLIAELKRRELEPRLAAVAAPEPEPDSAPDAAPRRPAGQSPTPEIRFALLRQSFHPRASAERRQELRSRLEMARARTLAAPLSGDGFGALAAEFSDDQATRYQGGDLGWIPDIPERLNQNPAIVAAARALGQPGDVSPVLQIDNGFYLVRLIGRRLAAPSPAASEPRPLQHHREERHARRAGIERDFEERARSAVPIVVHQDALAAIAVVDHVAVAAETPSAPGLP